MFDIKKPYDSLDKGSGTETKGADFVRQNGVIYAWSKSNVNYERAWWLYEESPRALELRKQRPLPEGVTIDASI